MQGYMHPIYLDERTMSIDEVHKKSAHEGRF